MPLSVYIPKDAGALDKLYEGGHASQIVKTLTTSEPRLVLFYEETVVGFIVRSSPSDQKTGIPYISVLSRINENPDEHQDSEIHSLLVQNPLTTTDQATVFQIWRFAAPVGFSRRDTGGSVTFVAQASDSRFGKLPKTPPKPEEVDSAQPGINLFEELNFSIARGKVAGFLLKRPDAGNFINNTVEAAEVGSSASADTLVSESEKEEDGDHELPRELAEITLPTLLPLLMRLRLTRLGMRSSSLFSTLSIEATGDMAVLEKESSAGKYQVRILEISAEFLGGKLADVGHVDFPMALGVHDVVNRTFKLELDAKEAGNEKSSRPLQLAFKYQVEFLLGQDFVPISSVVHSEWTPLLDFAPPQQHASVKSGTISSQLQSQHQGTLSGGKVDLSKKSLPLLKSSVSLKPPLALKRMSSPILGRPFSAESSPILPQGAFGRRPMKSTPVLQSSAQAFTINVPASTSSSISGLQLTFEGLQCVKFGKIVTWKVQAINHSQRTLNLTIIVRNRKKSMVATDSSTNLLMNSSTNIVHRDSPDDNLIATRVQRYNQYNGVKPNLGNVVMLTNDVRMGPIEPLQVFETEIQFLPSSHGVSNLNGLSLFDVYTGDGVEFGRMIELFVI